MLRVVVLEQVLEKRGDVLAEGVVSAVVHGVRRVPGIAVIAPDLAAPTRRTSRRRKTTAARLNLSQEFT